MKALIVEDEFFSAQNLLKILENIGSFEIIATLSSINETVKYLRNNDLPDLIFLDIHLSDGFAFELFEMVNVECPVIFVSASDEYAIRALRLSRVDYLLKPLDIFNVKRAIDKLRKFSKSDSETNDELKNLIAHFKRKTAFKTSFLVPVKGDNLVALKVDDIACLFTDHEDVRASTFDGRSFVMDHTLDELNEMINPAHFFRISSELIISRKAVKGVNFRFSGNLSIRLKVRVPSKTIVSKAMVPNFEKWLSEGHT